MSTWMRAQLAAGAAGVLCVLAGQVLSMPSLSHIGIGGIGLTLGLMGLEGIVERRMRMSSRYHRYRVETFVGAAAVCQGLLFVLMGTFLAGGSYLAWAGGGHGAFRYFARRPGLALLFFAAVLGAATVVTGTGSVEDQEGARAQVLLTAFASRWLPAIVLAVLAAGAAFLGVYEIVAPDRFDAMGGGVLEMLVDDSAADPTSDAAR